MPSPDTPQSLLRLLILEPDDHVLSQMERAISNASSDLPFETVISNAITTERIGTLRALHAQDLDEMEMVICALDLPDGSGLDALAYVQGLRPDLPVILTGQISDGEVAVEAIRAGAVDFLITSAAEMVALPLVIEKAITHQHIRHENDRLQSDLSRSLAELAVKNQQLHNMIGQLETMTRTDDLTGLSNRRWLNIMLEGNWADSSRNSLPLACVMIDLDGFKPVNDQLGHQRGDQLLRLAGKVIQANCRSVDTTARYGGDEFCVLMPHTKMEEAIDVARRILCEFEKAASNAISGGLRVSMSIGVAHNMISQPLNAEDLVHHADAALYAAKAAGKHCVAVRRKHQVVLMDALPSKRAAS
jgi:two-component system cell cycle response regulator